MDEFWSCIVITCPSLSSVVATEREIEYLKSKKTIPESLCVLTIEDPADNIGSGAATLNALLVAAEFLSAKSNYMVLSPDVLLKARILILHNGREYLFTCCGKGFIPLPLEYSLKSESNSYASGIMSNLESVLFLLDQLAKGSPCGVWVSSTDMFIKQTTKYFSNMWSNPADVVMFCIPSDVKHASGHGVVSVDDEGFVADILYCASIEMIQKLVQGDGKVPLVSGIVFLKTCVAESLLSLHIQSPLDSCTYLGLDSGNEPIQVSLFFDILVAMSTNVDKASFISGKCGKTYNHKVGIHKDGSNQSLLARSVVWEELSCYKMSPRLLEGSEHLYWSNDSTAQNHVSNMFRIAVDKEIHSICQVPLKSLNSKCLITNSCISSKSLNIMQNVVITDCHLEADKICIGENTFLSGIVFSKSESVIQIPENLVIMNAFVKECGSITLIFGMKENLSASISLDCGTFCNRPWYNVLKLLTIGEDDIWSSEKIQRKRTLLNAKMFSCSLSLSEVLSLFITDDHNPGLIKKWKKSKLYSISEVLENMDHMKVFDYKRNMYAKVASLKMETALCTNQNLHLLPYFYASCAEKWSHIMMDTLDHILLSDANLIIKTRTLSCTADLLSIKAGIYGGLRTGPGSNRLWSNAFISLLNGDIKEGMKALLEERSKWLGRPDHLMRAARHYERAAQILIQNSVKTVKMFMTLTPSSLPPMGAQITAECPARIDIQGGWSDTPPICYELGGSVVNIAVLMDGKKPIGAKASRIERPVIILKIGLGDVCHEVTLRTLNDVLNYNQPNAQGALLKAALICTNIIDVHSEETLENQLLRNFGGGFEIQSWSLLPQGCGMGTSSILAGAIVSVLWFASGKHFDKIAVVHAVLYVEQLLTTGGGWQDQVSGILGGINRGYSEASLPLCVKAEPLNIPDNVMELLNSHLLLIYTGKVRLAKNLLQNVIRNWYAREENVVNCFKDLIRYSLEMKQALLNGDLAKVGELMNIYWEQKKVLAPGCEPSSAKDIMDLTRPLAHGQLLVGAGGGGFMCILMKEAHGTEHIKSVLEKYKDKQKLTFHTVTVHQKGLEMTCNNCNISL